MYSFISLIKFSKGNGAIYSILTIATFWNKKTYFESKLFSFFQNIVIELSWANNDFFDLIRFDKSFQMLFPIHSMENGILFELLDIRTRLIINNRPNKKSVHFYIWAIFSNWTWSEVSWNSSSFVCGAPGSNWQRWNTEPPACWSLGFASGFALFSGSEQGRPHRVTGNAPYARKSVQALGRPFREVKEAPNY